MPTCPIETSEEGDAEWKEYRPRIEPDGRSFQDELVTIKGTRKQLTERLAKLFADWSPHDWIDRWNTHARHLTCVPLCTPLALPPSLWCAGSGHWQSPAALWTPLSPVEGARAPSYDGFHHRRPICQWEGGPSRRGLLLLCSLLSLHDQTAAPA